VLRLQPRVGGAGQHPAGEAVDAAHEAPSAGQRHVDLVRRRLPARRVGGVLGDRGDDRLDGPRDPADGALPKRTRRQGVAAPLDLAQPLHRRTLEAAAQQPLADVPALQADELDGQGLVVGLVAPLEGDAEDVAEEAPHGVLEEADQRRELDDLRGTGRQRPCEQRCGIGPRARQGPRARARLGVEAPRTVVVEAVRAEARGIEGLEGVQAHHVVGERLLARTLPTGGAIEDVQQLRDGDARRPLLVGALVACGVGDDQVLGGREGRVEQELTVLGPGVAIADPRRALDEIVAVRRRASREDRVVHPEQGDHPVRDRAHGHEGADGEVTGAMVGAARSPAEAIVQEGADLGQRDRGGGAPCLRDHVLEQPLELQVLPAVLLARPGERLGGGEQRVPPGDDGLLLVQ
jgi:hypothetical protein